MSDTRLDNLAGVSPLLSNLIVGVGADQNYIAEQVLAPIVTEAMTVTYRKGANEHLVAESATNTLRAPGTLPKTIDLSYSTGTMTLAQYALGAAVDYVEEQQARVNGQSIIDLKMAKLSAVKSKILLGKEQHVADLVFGAANYGANTGALDFGAAGLRASVFTVKETIRKGCGYDPNTLVLGPISVLEALENTEVKDMIKYSSGGVTQLDLLAQFFGVEKVIVGSAVKQTAAAAGASGTGSYVWTEDSAALLYVNRNSPSPYNPSFAYLAQQPERVFEWNNNPIITDMAYVQTYAAAIGLATAGYLFTATDGA